MEYTSHIASHTKMWNSAVNYGQPRSNCVGFLEHDRSQIDYYAATVGNMPGRVLTSHGIVERDGHDYHLTEKFSDLTD